MSESEFTELKNFQNGFLARFGFYSVNSQILQILIQTISYPPYITIITL
jgi:hypothetical protein